MSYQSELDECCKAMNQFARERLLEVARQYAEQFPEAVVSPPAPPLLTLVKNSGQGKGLSRSINRDVDRKPIVVVRKAVDL